MREGSDPVRIAYLADEERPALRLFLRALRRLPLDLPWTARCSPRDTVPEGGIGARCGRG